MVGVRSLYLPGTMRINEQGHLEIGGCDTVKLAREFGTPLFIYDVALIRERARAFLRTFAEENVKGQVAYASKAFSSIAMVQLVEEEGLALDVVSGGELYTALKAKFPPERIHFHGNNKSLEELNMALDHHVGCIVVDNFYELSLLEQLAREKEKNINVLIRVTPGVEAHTHDYILTGQEDSKFGFDLANGQAREALMRALRSKHFRVRGIHCHIGSQIFESAGFILAIRKIFDYLQDWKEELDFAPEILNLGGGFGIRYVTGDHPLPPERFVRDIISEVKRQIQLTGLTMPEIWIEPGRSIVGDAGTTLYTLGSYKVLPGIRKYVAVDGGMTDNIRPALYQAKYEAVIANRAKDEPVETVSIAGKACESGDMLIWDLPIAETRPGDLLAVFCTGAYGYAMASNYNRIGRPAVVFVENGDARLVIRRENYEDLVRLDLPYYELA